MDRRAEMDEFGGAARDPGHQSGRVSASACRGRVVWLGRLFSGGRPGTKVILRLLLP